MQAAGVRRVCRDLRLAGVQATLIVSAGELQACMYNEKSALCEVVICKTTSKIPQQKGAKCFCLHIWELLSLSAHSGEAFGDLERMGARQDFSMYLSSLMRVCLCK